MQHDFSSETTHRIDFQFGCCHRHHDHGASTQLARAQCNALRVIACRRANHTARQLRGTQMRHLVIGTAKLEAEDRLLVFALQ
ncbi:UNVERIFIED_ORG: hypothetical protein J2W38_002518 [Variovorax paradoxus]|nr:hypothetical protein [Variovorax paradoxus]